MDKKKILIASVSFYPRISPRALRTTELAIELAKQGHDVTVLTSRNEYDHSRFAKDYSVNIEYFINSTWQENKTKNPLSKIWYFFLWYFFMYPEILILPKLKKALLQRKGFDLLISIAKPYSVHWGVALALNLNNDLTKIWVADCGDPFMGSKESKLRLPLYFYIVEKWFCKKPDYIAVPIEKAVNAYPASCRNKIKIIPQGFNFDEVPEPKIVKNVIPTFAYAGALSKIRNPKQFLDFLFKLNIEFRFYVYTRSKAILMPYINMMGNKVIIKDYVPRLQLLDELMNMDFVVNFENRHDVQSPSKLIDYSLIKKPILSINCDQLDKQKVVEFLNGDYQSRLELKDVTQYNITNVVKSLLNLQEQ
jgi:glycosyltransferase involved in cell wall biosynthesis